MSYCCIRYCGSKRERKKRGKYSFHEFPCDIQMREKWIKVVSEKGMKDPSWQPYETSVLCNLHFQEDDFRDSRKVRRLKVSAIPSIFNYDPLYIPPRRGKRPTLQKIEMSMQKWARRDDSCEISNSASTCISENENEVEILGEYIQIEESEEYILS